MVLLLNYLPWIVIALGGFILYKAFKMESGRKRNRTFGATIIGIAVALLLLQSLTTGYYPKNRGIDRIPAPAFEQADAEIENRLRAPERLGNESEERFIEKTTWKADAEVKTETVVE